MTAALVMVENRPHRTSASSSTTGLMASSHDPTGTAGMEAAAWTAAAGSRGHHGLSFVYDSCGLAGVESVTGGGTPWPAPTGSGTIGAQHLGLRDQVLTELGSASSTATTRRASA